MSNFSDIVAYVLAIGGIVLFVLCYAKALTEVKAGRLVVYRDWGDFIKASLWALLIPYGACSLFLDNGDGVDRHHAGRDVRVASYWLIVVRALYGKAGEFVSTRLCRVSAGRATFEAAISGSLPSANATLGPDNELYVAIRLADSLRNVAAGVVPGPANPNEVTARLEAVGDSTQSKRITGTEPFYLTGWCLSASGQGEGVAVIDRHGVSHAATIVSDGHGQRITARLETEIPSGTATVVLATRGYFTQDGELHTYEKKVEVAAGETPPVVNPPRIDGAATQGQEDGVIETPGAAIEVRGNHLEPATSVSLYYGEDGASIEEMTHWKDLPATYNPDSGLLTTSDGPDEDAPASFGRVKVTTAGGSADYPVSYMVH